MIGYQGNLLNSAEKEVNEFNSRKYMEKYPKLKHKTNLKTEGSQITPKLRNQIFKLEDAFDISSKRDKLTTYEFVPSQKMPYL